MPELPEVETVKRGLAPVFERSPLARVRLGRPDLRFPFPPGFAERLSGVSIKSLERRAKYLVGLLEGGGALIMHLGMSGRFVVTDPLAPAPPSPRLAHERALDPAHDHVRFEFADGAVVSFNDPRRFGFMDLIDRGDWAASRWFAEMGPEPLSRAFGAAALLAALKDRRSPIKSLLLNQKIVAGVGNIYACEALHRARIAPGRLGAELSPQEAGRLARAVKEVLAEAIAAGGSTLRDYAAADGSMGYFQHAFQVYGREGQPCLRRACRGEIARAMQANRSTFSCPLCQI